MDKQFDAAIIGGGVIGCAIAWRLAEAGMRVVVIERGKIGGEASRAAGGMLAPLAEAGGADDFFHLAVTSRAMYADFARELKTATGIDIEYRTEGTLFLSLTEEDDEELDRRWRWQHEAGLNVKRLNADCARKLEPMINRRLRWALKFPDDHQVNNRRLVSALYSAALSAGVEFKTNTEVRKLMSEDSAGRKQMTGVITSNSQIRSATVIIAAGCWSSLLDNASTPTLEIEPVRGQMVAVEMTATPVNHVLYSRRGYIVPRFGGYLIAGSTSEKVGFDKRVTAGGVASIIERAKEILPDFNQLAITETWSGLRPHSPDDLPVLGADPNIEGLIYATGHYRNGILLTPITALAISELILKGESGINLSPFSSDRFIQRQADG
ncbi:MAG: glycine oxidase ThiO [Blastocatellales bacterium]